MDGSACGEIYVSFSCGELANGMLFSLASERDAFSAERPDVFFFPGEADGMLFLWRTGDASSRFVTASLDLRAHEGSAKGVGLFARMQ